MQVNDLAHLTPHHDINDLLDELASGLREILGDQLLALYLTGSLTYGDFDRGSSDIDFLAILGEALDDGQRASLVTLHTAIGDRFPEWRERIEGSYITAGMLPNLLPPAQGRPYINQGAFWNPDPPYGNEWLLNLYVLHECGIALVGPEPRDLIGPVAIADVRDASRRDLLEEWVPKIDNAAFFEDSHLQAYVTLTLCRILHRATHDEVASKRVAAAWVREQCGEPWRSLVERAERWAHGTDMESNQEVRDFIGFTRDTLEDGSHS